MAYARTQGIILRCTDYSESSQVAAVLTPDMGQVHVLAKGSRRPRKDARPPLTLLTCCDLVIARRAVGQLHILGEYSLREHFPGVAADLRRLWTAFYGDELILAFTTENADDGPLYGLFIYFLRRLHRGADPDPTLFQFLARALRTLGAMPLTDHCAQCGGPLHGHTRFSSGAGGVLCGDCSRADTAAFAISRGSLAVMTRLAAANGAGEAALRLTAAQVVEIQRAFAEQIQYHLGRPLRTERFLVERPEPQWGASR